jgi:hypothetical protein
VLLRQASYQAEQVSLAGSSSSSSDVVKDESEKRARLDKAQPAEVSGQQQAAMKVNADKERRHAGPISALGVGCAAVLLAEPIPEVPAELLARRTTEDAAAAAKARYLARKAEKKKT